MLISDLGEMIQGRSPWVAALIAISVFSIAGLPPLPGFLGKYVLLQDIWRAGATLSAVMFVIGMWHEASWRFGLWSVYWISVLWIAVLLRKNGIRIAVPAILKRLAMILVMAVSTIFIMPSSFDEVLILAGNFFRFSGALSKDLNISSAALSTAVLGFGVVMAVDFFAEKLKISYRTSGGSNESRRFHIGLLLLATFLLIFSVALAIGRWEKFIYLRY